MAYRRPFGLYQSAFAESDTNHDGVLNRNEFGNFLEFERADRNHDGRVNFREFAQSAAPNLGIQPRQSEQAFRVADRDHNGVLDRRELSEFSNFQHADLNHDGRIDPFEMRQYLGQNQVGSYQAYAGGRRRY